MTVKKIIVVALASAIAAGAVYLGYTHFIESESKVKFQKSQLTPDAIQLFSIADSSLFQLPTADRILLVYFNSDCHRCQKEFAEIEEAKDRFSGVEVVFFSIEPIRQISDFVDGYEFAGQQNFHFTKINPAHQAEVFGLLSAPSFFFYKQQKLMSEFKGRKSVDELLDQIR